MTLQLRASLEAGAMASGVRMFARVVTAIIKPEVMNTPVSLRQAWWDGFLSALVGAMAASMGEQRARECCEDLFTRAKDFESDQAKARPCSPKAVQP